MNPDPANLQQLPPWAQLILAWLSHQQFVIALLGLMTLDILCGIMQAIARKTLSSSMSFRGMAKKGTVLIILGVCATLQPFANGVPLLAPCAAWFLFTEAISILEHAACLGVKLPPFLIDALSKVREQKTLKDLAAVVSPTTTQPLGQAPIKIEATVHTDNVPPPPAPPTEPGL